jgi:DHA1 family tetracycline resistance protein-like MFS transporter
VSAAPRRAAFVFIFITILLDVLALGVIIPVLPQLVKSFSGGDTARAAETIGIFATVWALMQFVFSPILGVLSDRFGRRPVILISNFGLGFDYILMALAPSLPWLFVGRIISGITAASMSTAQAYIADVVAPDKRAGAYGMLGAAFGFGFVIGPALGGVLGHYDPRLPFWLAAGLSISNGIYGLFVLPESLAPENRSPFSWAKANPLGSLKLLGSKPRLMGLAAIGFFSRLAHEVLPSTFVLYAAYRYSWDERQVGGTLAAVGVCSVIVQGGLVRPVVKRLGERGAVLLGLLLGAAGFAIYGLASTGWMFLAGIPLMSMWGFSGPALQGLMTREVSASEQGQLQGANSSLYGISGMTGPLIFSYVFSNAIGRFSGAGLPGLPYLLAAGLLVLAAAVGFRFAKETPASPVVLEPAA